MSHYISSVHAAIAPGLIFTLQDTSLMVYFVFYPCIHGFSLPCESHNSPAASPRWPPARTCGPSRHETPQSTKNTYTQVNTRTHARTQANNRSNTHAVPPNRATFNPFNRGVSQHLNVVLQGPCLVTRFHC